MKGVAPQTSRIIEAVSQLECLKPFTLVGGTALSIQLNARESEDLDFMRWRKDKKDRLDVEWHIIEKELTSVGEVSNTNLMGFNHVEFLIEGVKLSFYASDNHSPLTQQPMPYLNNISLADIVSIGAMKMEVMLRRSKFRDYYDIYSILKARYSIEDMIDKALRYSGHRLKRKNLIAMLTSGSRFQEEKLFSQLNPKYNVTQSDIEIFIKDSLMQNR